jgi:hypothetical protein
MTKTDTHKRAMIEAMEKSLGIVTSACKVVGIARQTHYEWMKKDEDYKSAIEAVADIAIDFGESHLHKLIKDGSPAATIFFLKTKGKKRGYVERQEIETTGDNMFNVEIVRGKSED